MFNWITKHLRRKWMELSWGELFDKISILQVKMNRMDTTTALDLDKMLHIKNQYYYLTKRLSHYMNYNMSLIDANKAAALMERLFNNNYQQWDYENAMSLTGDEVPVSIRLEAMKNSYTQNRKRAIIKGEIDKLFKSRWMEVKQYAGMKNES